MQIAGYISTPPELKTVEGESFYQFRLAVLSGRAESRKTDWFTVRAYLSELDGDMLEKGQRVEITGVLGVRPYLSRDGKPAVDAVIRTQHVAQSPLKPPATAPAPVAAAPAIAVTPPVTPAPVAPVSARADVASSVLRPVVENVEEEPLPF